MKRAAILAALVASFAAASPMVGEAVETVASLHASLQLLDAEGRPVERAEDRQAVRLRLDLVDAQTGRPPDDLLLEAWVRAADPANPSCEASVRSFRATRSLAFGTVDLNGILLVSFSGGAVGVVDPKLNLRSSNMLAAHSLAVRPASVAADPVRMRLLASFPEEGQVRAFSLYSSSQATVATGLDRPTAIAMTRSGGFWLAEEGQGTMVHFGPDGERQATLPLARADGAISFRPVASDPAGANRRNPAPARLGAFSADGGLLLVEAETGRVLMRETVGEPIRDAAFLSNGAVLTLSAAAPVAHLRFAGRPAHVQTIPIAIEADRLAASPDGRFAIVYRRGGAMLAVIDIASAAVIQSVHFASGTVSDVLMTGTAGFILSLDAGFVGVMDVASVRPGHEAVLRRVPLAGTSPLPQGAGPFLVSLAPASMILVVDPEKQTGWILPEAAATSEIPPMDSVRLRGSIPETVIAVDRSFRKLAPGRYEATWAFDAGPQELVLTAGTGGFSRCLPFTVDGDPRRQSYKPVLLHVAAPAEGLAAGVPQTLTLVLRDRDGRDRTPEEMDVLLPSMDTSWRQVVKARRDPDGALRLSVVFPNPGPYALQPMRLPKGLMLQSTPVLEVPR